MNDTPIRARDIQNIATPPSLSKTLTANTKLPNCLIPDQIFQYLIIKNLTSNAVVLNVGTSAAGTDIVNGTNITANLYTVIVPATISKSARSLYFSSSNWNSASLKVTVVNFKP